MNNTHLHHRSKDAPSLENWKIIITIDGKYLLVYRSHILKAFDCPQKAKKELLYSFYKEIDKKNRLILNLKS